MRHITRKLFVSLLISTLLVSACTSSPVVTVGDDDQPTASEPSAVTPDVYLELQESYDMDDEQDEDLDPDVEDEVDARAIEETGVSDSDAENEQTEQDETYDEYDTSIEDADEIDEVDEMDESLLEVTPPPPQITASTDLMVTDSFFEQALFIGDSITTALNRYALFDGRVMAEMGLTVETAIERIPEFVHLNPDMVFVLLGSNDISQFYMNENLFLENYTRLIQTLMRYFPESKISIQSILPVAHHYSGPALLNNERITAYNHLLKSFTGDMGLTFIDIASAWRLPDLSLHPEVSAADGLHIASTYYGSWLYILKSSLS